VKAAISLRTPAPRISESLRLALAQLRVGPAGARAAAAPAAGRVVRLPLALAVLLSSNESTPTPVEPLSRDYWSYQPECQHAVAPTPGAGARAGRARAAVIQLQVASCECASVCQCH